MIDFLSQREVFLPSSFFRLFTIVDVGTRHIPTDGREFAYGGGEYCVGGGITSRWRCASGGTLS